ncbi:MAG TPA: PHP-associated domain-containing protein [Anaerolineaceae bacterium]|nr:PHP-associated domain-containing protein [Anaerolineaceae bacterium]
MPLWKVEFHCHTEFSRDSLTTIPHLLAAARRRGIDRLVVTDHNTIAGARAAQAADPERIIIGEEILTTQGELLACFVTEEVPPLLKPAEAIARLKDQGAFISVSHPFDLNRNGWQLPNLMAILPFVDAIEVFNARCFSAEINDQAAHFAVEHNLAGTVGSDAHAVFEIGRATLTLPHFASADTLRAVLRSGIQQVRLSAPLVHFSSVYARMVKRFRSRTA